MLDAHYLVQEIRKLDTKKIERFKYRLVEALINGLSYTVEELAYKSEYVSGGYTEYTQKMSPRKAVIEFINDWKSTNFDKINKQFEADFTLLKSVSLMTDIVNNGVNP
jgi:hypothetical protein